MPKEQINVASVGPTAAVTRRTLFMNVMKPREAKAKAKNKKNKYTKNAKRVTNHKRIQPNCNPFARRIQIHVCVCMCAYCSWAIKMEKKSNL